MSYLIGHNHQIHMGQPVKSEDAFDKWWLIEGWLVFYSGLLATHNRTRAATIADSGRNSEVSYTFSKKKDKHRRKALNFDQVFLVFAQMSGWTGDFRPRILIWRCPLKTSCWDPGNHLFVKNPWLKGQRGMKIYVFFPTTSNYWDFDVVAQGFWL